MKKIIAAFDGLKYSSSTQDYAIEISNITKSHLFGIFLDDSTRTSYTIYDLLGKEGVSENKLKKLIGNDDETRKKSVELFKQACQDAQLNFSIQHDKNIAYKEIIHESLYSDLLILNSKETFTNYEEKTPSRFIKNILEDIQCPVILVPEKFNVIEKIILLYDGTPASIFAIKMFNYIFPKTSFKNIELLSIKKMEDNLHIADNSYIKSLLKHYYKNITYTVLKGIAEEEIIHHLKDEKLNSMFVLGAYQRGILSRWLKISLADILMNELNSPLFIAHK